MKTDFEPIKESRARKRIRSRFSVRYRLRDEADFAAQTVETTDISSNGLAFMAPAWLPIGARLEILLDVPSVEQSIKADARVTRLQEIEEGTCYLVGVVFESISKSNERTIENYVQSGDANRILRKAVELSASDVHLVANRPPMCRISGALTPLDMPILHPAELERMILTMMTDMQKEEFDRELELDFAYVLPEGVRFRVNVHMEMGNIAAALRVISTTIRSLKELGLPPVIEQLATLQKGMIIVTGSAGTGKSTTLAAMVDLINRQRSCMIISVEDPIEYVHSTQRSIVKQREVGLDTHSFTNALKHVLRQDPNVILVGEMRDLDSISMSITAAETGHLVLTSLHTPSATECINRIIDVYPSSQQHQVRNQLAECLQAVIGQVLLPRKDGAGMAVATEVLIGTPAIRNLIRQGQTEQIPNCIQSGSMSGMHILDGSLLKLVTSGVVDFDVAKAHARNPGKFAV
ncbi:MAG: PilT/PilU family type 4a pilus ATPase [bacterium]